VFIEAKDDGGGGDNWTTGAISCAKLQSNHHHEHPVFFASQMPFLSPNQQWKRIEGKTITFHGLAYSKLTWHLPTLSLTTNSSWLPWGGLPCLSSSQLLLEIISAFLCSICFKQIKKNFWSKYGLFMEWQSYKIM